MSDGSLKESKKAKKQKSNERKIFSRMSVKSYCVYWCVCPSDMDILIITLTALISLLQMCLLCLFFSSCFSAAVRSDPITFGHVELNAGNDWVIIFSA